MPNLWQYRVVAFPSIEEMGRWLLDALLVALVPFV